MNNEKIIERFYSEIWELGKKEVLTEIIDKKIEFRGSTGPIKKGAEEFWQYVELIRGALDQYKCVIEEIITEGNTSYAKMIFKGIHTGKFFGVEKTGKEIEWAGIARFKINEKIENLWVLGDVDSIKVKLGLSQARKP